MVPSLSVHVIYSLLSLFLLLLKTLWNPVAGDRRGRFCWLSPGGSADDGRTWGDCCGQLLHGPKTQCWALDRPWELWAPSPWHCQPSLYRRLVEAVCMCLGCKTEIMAACWPKLAVTKMLPDWIQHVYWEYTCQVWCHVCLHITDIGAVYCTGDLPFHWPKELINTVVQSHSDYRSTPVSVLRAPK